MLCDETHEKIISFSINNREEIRKIHKFDLISPFISSYSTHKKYIIYQNENNFPVTVDSLTLFYIFTQTKTFRKMRQTIS